MNAPALQLHEQTPQADFRNNGFAVVDTLPLSADVLASFGRMPRDGHSLKRLREIRLSQYWAYSEEGEWILALLPKRRYIQSADYIKLAEAGGVFRYREQMEVDLSPLIGGILDHLPIERTASLHINVNQIRVIANDEYKGVTVPEGPHRDGHEYSVIAVIQRHNVSGGETQVIDPASNAIVYRQVLAENQAILIDDERYIHYATDIAAQNGEPGYRDILVIEINHWDKRAYGPKHERRASGA